MSTYDTITTVQAFCGETPHYIKESDNLIWIDSGNPVLYIYQNGSNSVNIKTTPYPLEGLVPREGGGWIAPTVQSILYLNNDFELEQELKSLLPTRPPLAFHDCCAGPDGSLYVGSYDAVDYTAPRGCIYRLSPDLKFSQVAEKLALPNGSGFSPDGKIFYINEMMASRILAYEFDITSGTLSNKRILCEIPQEKGYPDGMTIDSKGCIWVALWQGYGIMHIDPNGKTIEEIKMDVPSPTCMTFGGSDRQTLYISSAVKGLSDEQLSKHPDSGRLFRMPTKTKGLAARYFRG